MRSPRLLDWMLRMNARVRSNFNWHAALRQTPLLDETVVTVKDAQSSPFPMQCIALAGPPRATRRSELVSHSTLFRLRARVP